MAVEGTHMKPVLRQGNMAYIPSSGGPRAGKGIERGNMRKAQLYDLSSDIGQMKNLAEEKPDIVEKMAARLKEVTGSES